MRIIIFLGSTPTQERIMAEYQILAVFAAFAFLYCLVASRLERTRFSGALFYVVCGLVLGPFGIQLITLDVDGEGLKALAEITLAVVLFSDAAGANLGVLRKVERLPARLLLIGLPLTIALGYLFGTVVYRELSWIPLALLATMLAPTDAALGKAVVTNESVPSSVREGLNVESGLNDGICVPVLLLFLSLPGSFSEHDSITSQMLHLMLKEIGIGAVVGIPSAVLGSLALKSSMRNGWIAGSWVQVPVVALSLLCFGTAQALGGSGFIASFAGGLTFGAIMGEQKKDPLEGSEATGDVLSIVTWFVFGAMFIGDSLRNPDWQAIAYAALSLTVIRMVPVFLVVAGMGMRWDTKLFLGWFGPRGLASIVFIVMVAQANVPGIESLKQAVAWTVLLSVIAHGISANPLAKAYAARVAARDGAI